MPATVRPGLIAWLCICTLLLGCQGLAPSATRTNERSRVEAPDAPRPRVHSDAAPSSTGCRLRYDVYSPVGTPVDGRVVLGHGFMRSKERMAGLAESLAAAGIETVSMDFCNTRLWDGKHVQNGLDMARLGGHLGGERIVYAGFSAGGLAALVAAHNDPHAIGVLTLDLVDADAIGRQAAAALDVPIVAFFGDPSSCNAANNGLAAVAVAREANVKQFAGASHCDFESPTDWLCRAVCESQGGNGPQLGRDIIAAATAAITEMITDADRVSSRRLARVP